MNNWNINTYFENREQGFPLYIKRTNIKFYGNLNKEFKYQLNNINNNNNEFILKQNFFTFIDEDDEIYNCICGHRIKIIYVIQNTITGDNFGVGSDCIKKNMNEDITEQLKKLKTRKEYNDKINIKKRYKKVLNQLLLTTNKSDYHKTARDISIYNWKIIINKVIKLQQKRKKMYKRQQFLLEEEEIPDLNKRRIRKINDKLNVSYLLSHYKWDNTFYKDLKKKYDNNEMKFTEKMVFCLMKYQNA